jgi:hypothetical protein
LKGGDSCLSYRSLRSLLEDVAAPNPNARSHQTRPSPNPFLTFEPSHISSFTRCGQSSGTEPSPASAQGQTPCPGSPKGASTKRDKPHQAMKLTRRHRGQNPSGADMLRSVSSIRRNQPPAYPFSIQYVKERSDPSGKRSAAKPFVGPPPVSGVSREIRRPLQHLCRPPRRSAKDFRKSEACAA